MCFPDGIYQCISTRSHDKPYCDDNVGTQTLYKGPYRKKKTLKSMTWENEMPTPPNSSGLPNMLGDKLLGSISLPVKSSSDSSNDDAEDNPADEELDSFLWNRKGAGEPPHPLSEQGESSSGCKSSENPPMLNVKSRICGLS